MEQGLAWAGMFENIERITGLPEKDVYGKLYFESELPLDLIGLSAAVPTLRLSSEPAIFDNI